ncbi:MAG: ABC transporter permease [Bacteroidetes bacterium]|nr:ABC transporter permease [Bacteroidota bacterium]
MLKNFIRTAVRNLWKYKGFTAINIIGLATGIATCLVIILYVINELGYDKYNTKADHIFRIDEEVRFGDNYYNGAETPALMGPVFAKEFPAIQTATRLIERGGLTIKRDGAKIAERSVVYADSTLFSVFTLPFLDGNPATALVGPNSLVISETIAKKYFNTTKAVGKSFDANGAIYQVTGVIKDMPQQSHFRFDFFISLSSRHDNDESNWLSNNYHTYVVLAPGTDPVRFNEQLTQRFESYVDPIIRDVINLNIVDFKKGGGFIKTRLMPLTKIHLYSHVENELDDNGNIQYVYIFGAIATFILLIACVNFMNLSTARSAGRAKEVGIRKVMGSLRSGLVGQFLIESMLISFVSFVLAVGLLFLFIPLFNQLAQQHLRVVDVFRPSMIAILLAVMIITGLLAGSYPAFVLSAFQPIDVLKGKLSRGLKGSLLRNSLVVFQFTVSIILMVSTGVIYRQLSYIRHKDIGFDKEQLLVIRNAGALGNQAQAFKKELSGLPGISGITYTAYLPIDGWRSNDAMFPTADLDIKKAISAQQWEVDADYIPTLQIQMKAGRNFSRDLPTDSSAVVINEAAAAFLKTKNPIGATLYRIQDIHSKKLQPFTVIGVVKNFNFSSLREKIMPLSLHLSSNTASLAMRVKTRDVSGLIAQIKSKWKAMVPSEAIRYTFLDEDFNRQYEGEERTGKISIAFSALAILIACLGLFGLVTYAAEQRTKEIGIRKVLGANVAGIVAMLSRDFVRLVTVAILVASPLAWFAMNKWLQDFAYRVEVPWWLFPVAGFLALLIAVVTASFQAIKAALANPVKSLRSE